MARLRTRRTDHDILLIQRIEPENARLFVDLRQAVRCARRRVP